MRIVGRLLILALAALSMVLEAVPASAEGRSGAYIDGSGNPTAEVSTVERVSEPPPSSGTPSNCTWRKVSADDSKVTMYDESGRPMSSPTGRWYQKVCGTRTVDVNGNFSVPESPPVDPAALAQRARESVEIPPPPVMTSPPTDRNLFTGVPTWLWIDANWWRDYPATAQAGGASSTVVARPVRAVWRMGDGGKVICNGPGTEWRPGMADGASTCSYVYKDASAGQRAGTFTLSVEVEFEVSWTSSIGPGGTLPSITRSASREVEVGEIQAVETE